MKRLPLSPAAIAGLAALGVPRVVAHDLDLGVEAVYGVLTVVPLVVWLWVGLRNPESPFLALLAIGVAYGVLLAVTHQVLWAEAFEGDPPRLGGNLEDFPDEAHTVLTRTAAFFSSLATGAAVGAILGGLAVGLRRASRVLG